mgnify:CR=1 FL=1
MPRSYLICAYELSRLRARAKEEQKQFIESNCPKSCSLRKILLILAPLCHALFCSCFNRGKNSLLCVLWLWCTALLPIPGLRPGLGTVGKMGTGSWQFLFRNPKVGTGSRQFRFPKKRIASWLFQFRDPKVGTASKTLKCEPVPCSSSFRTQNRESWTGSSFSFWFHPITQTCFFGNKNMCFQMKTCSFFSIKTF